MVYPKVNPEVTKLKRRQRHQRYRSNPKNQKKIRDRDRIYRQKKRAQIAVSQRQKEGPSMLKKN